MNTEQKRYFETEGKIERRRLLDESDDDEVAGTSTEESPLDEETKSPNYQIALDSVGFGKFHWWLLLVCGLANASDAVEILCVSLLIPAVQCDYDLNSSEKGWVGAIIFIGMMMGSYMWGALGDIYGRRNTLSLALLVNGVFGGLSALAQSYGLFMFMRLISGLGVGGSIPLVFSYFAEFQPTNQRASQMCFLASFWMIGNIITAGLGWLIIPHYEIGYFSENFTFNSWRIFIVSCSFFSFSSACLLFCFPKSPIFLIRHGHFAEAERIFRKIYSINHVGASNYESSVIEKIRESNLSPKKYKLSKNAVSAFKKLGANVKQIFQKALLKNTLLLIIINFSIAFGYYGLWLWFPELFNRLALYSKTYGEQTGVCDMPKSFIRNMTSFQTSINCSAPVAESVFVDSFILSVSNLPGNIITILFIDKFGRKYFLAGGLVISSVSIFFIWLVKTRLHNLVLSSVFGGVTVVSFNALNIISAELFPTEVRATATGILLFMGRIGAILGNIVFGYFIDLNCEVPILLVAALLCGSGLLSILIPNTTRTNLK